MSEHPFIKMSPDHQLHMFFNESDVCAFFFVRVVHAV